ncbi:MAG: Uma2 family endonuclease [Deltaproteobacteria bacterium]|nr:Uma2 family endonuclease [Deltaproteobacteria bacterium]
MTNVEIAVCQRHRLTVAEYYRMAEVGILSPEARVELIEGEVIDMPPIGSRHAGTVKYLTNRLMYAVGDRAIVSAQDPIFLDVHSEPQPDIALLRPRSDFYRNAHPTPVDVLLVVEVADSTLAYDTQIKLPLYARHHIPEVWLVDLVNQRLSIHCSPTASGFQDVQPHSNLSTVTPLLLAGVMVDLSDLF